MPEWFKYHSVNGSVSMTFDDLWESYIVDSCEYARIPKDSAHFRNEPEERHTLSENVEEIEITEDEADEDNEEEKKQDENNA